MKNNIYNLIKFNLTYILIILIILFFFISLVNYFFSGHPRYWEIIHGRDKSDLKEYKIRKEKIIKLKKKNIETNYMSVLDPDYKELNYSGKYVSGKCGSIENGYNELIYKTDKYGFRENEDFRYIYSDYVLLGDSFTQSICENKPNDLKTLLINSSEHSFLNLGMQGTDYPDQAKKLIYYLNETGIWKMGNLVFGHASIFDYHIIDPKDIDHLLKNEDIDPQTITKIALYHGRINGVELFNGTKIDGETNTTTKKTITPSNFAKYDLSFSITSIRTF